MKITLGEWKTRDGMKAEVVYVCEKRQRVIGWIVTSIMTWQLNGRFNNAVYDTEWDLIAPWTDPVPWDWSTTPPWMFWLFQKESGGWLMSDIEPVLTEHGHGWKTVGYVLQVPSEYAPKWSGDWKLSKTMRPGYKEVK